MAGPRSRWSYFKLGLPSMIMFGVIGVALFFVTGSADAAEQVAKVATEPEKVGLLEIMLTERLPALGILLAVVAFVILRLPKLELGHDKAFVRRRVMNWLPLGLTYAFLYMGRYNLTVSKGVFGEMVGADGGAMMGNGDFGVIFGIGTVVYGFSFLINGPLADRHGGRLAILVGAGGSAVMNALMGLCTYWVLDQSTSQGQFIAENFVVIFSVLYAVNMYFQSFGAIAIVKVNAHWFHVRERGVFGAIFGILISLGIYFAFDVGKIIRDEVGVTWLFIVPAVLIAGFWVIDFFLVRNSPSGAGLEDFDTADASSGDDGPQKRAVDVFIMMMKNPVIVTIACIEFCSGFLRQAIMNWYPSFATQTNDTLHLKSSFVNDNWGLLLACAGIMGGVIAGIISDRIFSSRRGPVAFILYAAMLAAAILLAFVYATPMVGWLIVFMSMAVIGVHGMLSGSASMDFGGRKNVGIAVGIIDGFVYLGTATMALTYSIVLPDEEFIMVAGEGGEQVKQLVGPATDPSNWLGWPLAMIPLALIGVILARKVWNAKPKPMGPSSGALGDQATAEAATEPQSAKTH